MVINSRVMSGGHNLRENWRNRQWTRARNILSSGTKCATICELSSHLLSSRSIVDISAALFCVAHSRMLIPEKRLNLHIEQRDQFARCESHAFLFLATFVSAMFMPRVVVLWHRTGFIRRRSRLRWCIGYYTLARHLTRLGKMTFPTINIATAPRRYTHAVRQPMPTTRGGDATVPLKGTEEKGEV